MSFWEDLGKRLERGGMSEETWRCYSAKSDAELIRRAKNHDPNALLTLKIRYDGDDERVREMIRRGY